MKKKIEWFQEVLALEPGSKVFYPLARLFAETNQPENAVLTLQKGLDRHPEYMEARLLLIQILIGMGRMGEIGAHLKAIVEPLEAYPEFWKAWSRSARSDSRELAAYLTLIASHASGEPVTLGALLDKGLDVLSGDGAGGGAPSGSANGDAPESALTVCQGSAEADAMDELIDSVEEIVESVDEFAAGELDEPLPKEAAESFRTRTMADLLILQRDYLGALDIYRELESHASPGELSALRAKIDELQARALASEDEEPEGESDPFCRHAKNRLVSTLETLAARFEARVRS